MSDEQNAPENQEEKPAESAPASDVAGAETLVLPREEDKPAATDADAKAEDLSDADLEKATAPDATPGEILADQNPDFIPPNKDPEFVARHSKRTAS